MAKSSDRKMALALGIINCFINEDTSVLAITSPFKIVQRLIDKWLLLIYFFLFFCVFLLSI